MGLVSMALGTTTTFYVDPQGGHQVPFDSWADAATNIQYAVNEASAGDTIRVAPGRYRRPSNAVERDGWNVVHIANKPLTLIADAGPAHTIIDGEDAHRGIMLYQTASMTTYPYRIDGFTITGGYATHGGGIRGDASGNFTWDVELRNCILEGNTAEQDGGGLQASFVSANWGLTLSNTIVRGNQTLNGFGGGIKVRSHREMRFYDCIVEYNTATNNPYVSTSQTVHEGGGLYLHRLPSVVIERTLFRGNRVSGYRTGAAVHLIQAGGSNNADLLLRNCLFYDNVATGNQVAGAVYAMNQTGTGRFGITLENSTIGPNTGGFLRRRFTDRTEDRVWAWNTLFFEPGLFNIPSAQRELHYCRVDEGFAYTGGNSITDLPAFVDFEGRNFRLSADSPCINAGTNLTWTAEGLDLDRKPRRDRIFDQTDIGAYEYVYAGTILLLQ